MNRHSVLKTFCIVSAVAVLFSLSSCSNKGEKKESYTFGGSSTVAPIMNETVKEWESENPNLKVSYETLGSSVGIKQLKAGTLSLAASSRELKQSEIDDGYKTITIALDGISIVVNKDVNISNIALSDLAKVYAGEITNWKELGGQDEKIEIISRDETSGTYTTFKEMVLDSAKKEQDENAIIAKENGEVAMKVASLSGSIGYVGMAFNEFVEENGGKVISVNGVYPNKDNVKNGSYTLSRPLYLVYRGEVPTGNIKAFIDYVLSDKGQKIVENTGFISIN